jgi:hypothetical protein
MAQQQRTWEPPDRSTSPARDRQRSHDHYVDSWRRVLIATRNGINAATRVHDLRGRDSDLLRAVYADHDQLSSHFDAFVAEQSALPDA